MDRKKEWEEGRGRKEGGKMKEGKSSKSEWKRGAPDYDEYWE